MSQTDDGRQCEISLPDALDFIVDNRGRSCPVVEDGFPLIATNCVKKDRRDVVFANLRYVDEDTRANWFRAHPVPGDILFVCKGSPGRMAVVPDPVPYCIAQDMVALRANESLVNGLYLYYRLSAPDAQERIRNMHVGTLIPHFKKGDFGRLRFNIYNDLAEQSRIAATLGALDDLIDGNRRTSEDLRALAAALYVRAASASQEFVRLGDVASVNATKTKPSVGSVRYLDIASIGNGSIQWPEPIDWQAAPSRARLKAKSGSTLWSTVRPNRLAHAFVVEAPDDLVVSTGIAVLTPTDIGSAHLFAASEQPFFVEQLIELADGSA